MGVMTVVVVVAVAEFSQQAEERGGKEKEEKRRSDAREERRGTRERTVIATTSPRESPTIRSRVPVIMKSVDPDTVYRPRLSGSLACRCLHLLTRLHLPIYPLNSWGGGAIVLLSHEDASERARSTDACRCGRFFMQGERVPPGSRDWLIQKS